MCEVTMCLCYVCLCGSECVCYMFFLLCLSWLPVQPSCRGSLSNMQALKVECIVTPLILIFISVIIIVQVWFCMLPLPEQTMYLHGDQNPLPFRYPVQHRPVYWSLTSKIYFKIIIPVPRKKIPLQTS